RARAAAAGVRRVSGGARAAALELGRHHRAAARRPLACRGPARDPAHDARLGRHAPPRPAMTFRARLLLGFGAVVLVPLTVFGLRIRAVMANRLTAEYQQRVAALVSVIRADLDRQSAGIAHTSAATRCWYSAVRRFAITARIRNPNTVRGTSTTAPNPRRRRARKVMAGRGGACRPSRASCAGSRGGPRHASGRRAAARWWRARSPAGARAPPR